jgi:hypothetical protein
LVLKLVGIIEMIDAFSAKKHLEVCWNGSWLWWYSHLIFITRLSAKTAANIIMAVPSHFQPMSTISEKGWGSNELGISERVQPRGSNCIACFTSIAISMFENALRELDVVVCWRLTGQYSAWKFPALHLIQDFILELESMHRSIHNA